MTEGRILAAGLDVYMAMLAAENMVKALIGEVPPNIVPELK